jgi:two-component system, LuxR family, sensor kinase FixL
MTRTAGLTTRRPRGIGADHLDPHQDIHAAKEALQEREARLRSILETAPDAIILIDERGIMESYSPAAERLFGYPPQDVLGQNVSMLMPSPYRERHDSYLDHYLRTGERRIIGIGRIVVGRRKDGSTFPMELAVGEARVTGRRVFTGFIRDLTERQLTESRMQELQTELLHVSRLSDVGQMASALAHELNQPLAAIVNYVQATRRMLQASATPLSPRILETMDKAVAQAARAGEIIQHLRSFIRKGETERSIEDLSKMVEEATALGLVGAKEGGIKVQIDLTGDPLPVFIDKVQIQQVVFNLIRNSVEALPEADVREMAVTTRRGEGGMALAAVSDSGPGLAQAVAEQLFQPFVTTKEKGMGLGLSICRSIIEAHGGRLWATPNPERGVTFQFSIPMADDDEPETQD